ncbi:hypothetical protein CsSME_00027289 [Camellia sinensis var. sinensis]
MDSNWICKQLKSGHGGAVATTCGKSKLVPLTCGYAFTISAMEAPVPPPTSTRDPMQSNPCLYSDIKALIVILAVHSMPSLKTLLSSGSTDAKSHNSRPWAIWNAFPPSCIDLERNLYGAVSNGWYCNKQIKGARLSSCVSRISHLEQWFRL